MKRGFGGLSVTKISFILVTLVCTTLLMFGWDKAPFLSSLFPQNQLQKVSADNFIGSPVKSMTLEKERHAGNNLSASASDGTFDKPKGKMSDSVTRSASADGYNKRSNEEMWACRATDRINFAYEKFRWQPKDCEVEEFSGSKFLRRRLRILGSSPCIMLEYQAVASLAERHGKHHEP
ncbi:hypothetical protein Cgig2_017904 [Carnegiea gigantea]|uniref:Trichome birefringence-like N-terminal domain-containing protein n=1 Tax=Carnegiea gigantea TaxID=171969 RepID=A0A9Q1QDJ5_9CARY|nr:hypothetical protein Cgig2_017904 [Carnegiea gigantea]